MKVKTIDAGDFTKQCPALLDQLDFEGLVITKHGKPVGAGPPVGIRGLGFDWQPSANNSSEREDILNPPQLGCSRSISVLTLTFSCQRPGMSLVNAATISGKAASASACISWLVRSWMGWGVSTR